MVSCLPSLLLLALFAQGASAASYLRHADTSKETVTVQVPQAFAVHDRQLEIFASACATCEQTVRIPTNFEVETAQGACTPNFCTWDCENCIKQFGVKVCSPFKCSGTSAANCGSSCIDVPTAVNVDWEDMTVCDAAMSIPKAVGADADLDNITDAVDKAFKMCPCYGKIPEYVAKFDVADFRTAAIAGAGELFDCLVTQGLVVKNNTAEVEQGDLSDAGGDKIIRAPHIDLAIYTSISAAAVGCATGSTCDTVITILLQYFKDAAAQVSGELADWLKAQVQGALDAAVAPATEAVDRTASSLATVQQQLAACPASNPAVAEAQAAVADFQKAQVSVQQLVSDAQQLQQSTKEAVAAVQGMADALSKSYEEHLVNAAASIMQGDLNFLDTVNFIAQSPSVVTALQNAQAFAQSASTLQQNLAALPAAGTKAQQAVAALHQEPTQAPGMTCTVDASGLDVGVVVQTAQAAVQGAQAQLEKIDPTRVQCGVATINRHFEVSADLPCSKKGTCKFGPKEVAVKVDCPKVYVCTAEADVPMPNEHIPYLRIKGGSAGMK